MNDVKNRNNTKKEIISNEILKNHKLFIKKPATDNQKKHSRRYNEICNTFSSYLSNSTLHGLYYVGNAQLSYGERLCWLISFLVALGCAIYFIINIYIKYTTNSLLLSLNPIPIPMKDIPFPAVTICNMNLANKNESLLIIKNGSDSEKSILDNICRIEDDTTAGEGTNGTSRWDELKNIMLKISQPCDKMLQMCRWHLRKMQCDEIFNVVATDEGLCCTFNMLPLNLILRNTNRTEFDSDYSQTVIDDWNPERGYTPDSPDDIYPFRSQGIVLFF
ncbi:hypothetical protein FQR65_LT10270 [Abscondita terminalis]|nr:hypothetical protein FQR65_LT10270 [Abscondita terminalis]